MKDKISKEEERQIKIEIVKDILGLIFGMIGISVFIFAMSLLFVKLFMNF